MKKYIFSWAVFFIITAAGFWTQVLFWAIISWTAPLQVLAFLKTGAGLLIFFLIVIACFGGGFASSWVYNTYEEKEKTINS